jgi:hypothetical protein
VEEKTAVSPELNRLYWETDSSVAEISNRLGVSRRAMYEAIEPMPSGVACESCGAELYFNNRSARTSGIGRCLVCGSEHELDAENISDDIGMIPPYPTVKAANIPERDQLVAGRTAMIATFAVAGLLTGVLTTFLIRRKR